MKLQELRNLIRSEVRKEINESTSKRRLKEDLSSIDYSKVTKAFKEMKKWNFEDADAQEDFINEINKIAKQLGIIDIDLVDEPDVIQYFLERVQEDTVSASTMLRELKSFLQELVDEFSGHTRM